MPEVAGVRLATGAAGIKYKGRTDVLLALFDEGTTVAGVTTRSKCPSAPVEWCREKLKAGKARALRLAENAKPIRRAAVAEIPLFGSIPAGFGQDREQEAEGCVTVDVATIGFKPTRNTFALRVVGDSMIGRHVCNGDIVILEHGPEPCPFLLGPHRLGARARALRSDVDRVRSLRGHGHGAVEGRPGGRVEAALGEGIGRGVQDSHHARASGEIPDAGAVPEDQRLGRYVRGEVFGLRHIGVQVHGITRYRDSRWA